VTVNNILERKNQNDKIEKYMCIAVSHIDIHRLPGLVRKPRAEVQILPRVARNVLCVPVTNASSKRNFIVAMLV
jgi:hypothetical protein